MRVVQTVDQQRYYVVLYYTFSYSGIYLKTGITGFTSKVKVLY